MSDGTEQRERRPNDAPGSRQSRVASSSCRHSHICVLTAPWAEVAAADPGACFPDVALLGRPASLRSQLPPERLSLS